MKTKTKNLPNPLPPHPPFLIHISLSEELTNRFPFVNKYLDYLFSFDKANSITKLLEFGMIDASAA
jgi:hypothetical protein